MKRFALRLAVFLMLVLLVSCSESEDAEATSSAPVVAVKKGTELQAVRAFKVPETTRITVSQARMFADASAALFLLGQQWSARLERATDAEKMQIVQSYEQAREQLVNKMGLAGLDEFNWIQQQALPDTLNRTIFSEVGIKVP
jgi:hypothetical protein